MENQPLQEKQIQNNVQQLPFKRRIKIEERGDYFARKTIPLVRLKGQWLYAAGFPPGQHIRITIISNGVIELRLESVTEMPEQRRARQAVMARLENAIKNAR